MDWTGCVPGHAASTVLSEWVRGVPGVAMTLFDYVGSFSSDLENDDKAGSSVVVRTPYDCEIRGRRCVGYRCANELTVAGDPFDSRSRIAISLRRHV